MRSRGEFEPGSEARTLDGPFAGSVCTVVDVRGHEARILMTLFGAARKVSLDPMMLEAA